MSKIGRIGSALKRAALYIPRKIGIVPPRFAKVTYHRRRKIDLPKSPDLPYSQYDQSIFIDFKPNPVKSLIEDYREMKVPLKEKPTAAIWEKAHVRPEDVMLVQKKDDGTGHIKRMELNLDSEFADQNVTNALPLNHIPIFKDKGVIHQRRRWPASVNIPISFLAYPGFFNNMLWLIYAWISGLSQKK